MKDLISPTKSIWVFFLVGEQIEREREREREREKMKEGRRIPARGGATWS